MRERQQEQRYSRRKFLQNRCLGIMYVGGGISLLEYGSACSTRFSQVALQNSLRRENNQPNQAAIDAYVKGVAAMSISVLAWGIASTIHYLDTPSK